MVSYDKLFIWLAKNYDWESRKLLLTYTHPITIKKAMKHKINQCLSRYRGVSYYLSDCRGTMLNNISSWFLLGY